MALSEMKWPFTGAEGVWGVVQTTNEIRILTNPPSVVQTIKKAKTMSKNVFVRCLNNTPQDDEFQQHFHTYKGQI